MSAFRPALPFQKLQTIFVCWGPRRSINDVNLGSKPWRGYGLRMVRETQRFEHRERRSVVDVGGRSCLSNHEIFRKKRADNDICPICTLEIFDDINSNTPLCIKHNNQYLPYPLKVVKKKHPGKECWADFMLLRGAWGKGRLWAFWWWLCLALEDHPIK